MSIYTGSCLVTCIKTLGGNLIYDLVRVVGGNGISSNPWQVLSLITSDTYLVTASMVVKESYYSDNLNGAKAVYMIHVGKSPNLLPKFEVGHPNSTPVC
jgi:hypothetical protein